MTTELVPATRPATPAQLDWLTHEVRSWQSEGLLEDGQADRILHSYHASRRFSLGRLLLALGGTFVGVGLIWLVAANLDALPPTARLVAVAAIWVSLLVTGEALNARGGATGLVGAVRLMAVLSLGATIFQAAQSFQVPAYEPRLVGLWAAGALLHAYAASARGPLLVGIAAGASWFIWQALAETTNPLTGVLALGALAVVATAAAALHGDHDAAGAWRATGTLLGLSGLFVAALPFVGTDGWEVGPTTLVGLGVAGVAVAAALVRGRGSMRLEPVGAVATLLLSVGLVAWEAGRDAAALTTADWGHAAVSVAAYVLVAVGVASLGILRDSWVLTAQATAALVVFTTFQSFAVFAQIIQGAWLFVFLGLVFLGTGLLFDRARRELAATLEGDA